jgi:hypothetical protein
VTADDIARWIRRIPAKLAPYAIEVRDASELVGQVPLSEPDAAQQVVELLCDAANALGRAVTYRVQVVTAAGEVCALRMQRVKPGDDGSGDAGAGNITEAFRMICAHQNEMMRQAVELMKTVGAGHGQVVARLTEVLQVVSARAVAESRRADGAEEVMRGALDTSESAASELEKLRAAVKEKPGLEDRAVEIAFDAIKKQLGLGGEAPKLPEGGSNGAPS